jgi:hypothetical protein
MDDKPIHERYLPYSVEEVEKHLAEGLRTNIRQGARYFSNSIDRLNVDQLAYAFDFGWTEIFEKEVALTELCRG